MLAATPAYGQSNHLFATRTCKMGGVFWLRYQDIQRRWAAQDFRIAFMDKVDASTRSRIMAHIKSKNTKPELTVRRGLFARGLRFRLHVARLPGRPDLVFPKHHAIVQVHGCFWHGHQQCKLFKPPVSNVGYWTTKIAKNLLNDERSTSLLIEMGWRVRIVWECNLRAQPKESLEALLDELADWVRQG